MMPMLALLCFVVCGLLVLSGLRKGSDLLSPGRVFGSVWCLTLGLAELKLSRLQHAWSMESWIVLLIGPAAFLVGVFSVAVVTDHSHETGLEGIRARWRKQYLDTDRLFRAVTVLFLLFLLGFGSILASGKEIPVFSAQPGRARLAFQLFGVGLFLHNAFLIVLFSLIYVLSVGKRRLSKLALEGMSAASVLLYGLTLQRFQIVMAAIVCVAFLYYATCHLRVMTVTGYLAVAVLFFLLISTVRSGQLFVYYLYLDSRMTFPPAYAVFTEPYMYFAMNVENYARAIDGLSSLSWGVFTLDPLAAVTGLKHWMRDYFGIVETPYLNSGYNTYTFFWPYYRDFGVVGLALLSLVGGGVVSTVYRRMKREPTVGRVAWYCVCVFVMLFSFYLNPLTFLWFAYNLVALALVLRFVVRKPRPRAALAVGWESV